MELYFQSTLHRNGTLCLIKQAIHLHGLRMWSRSSFVRIGSIGSIGSIKAENFIDS
jgi:hypothetical protein